MASPTQAFDTRELLAHDRYLRALARSLVLDPHAAEDIAQQTWLAAMLGQPRGPTVRAWLAATVRNLAAKMHLAEVRRWRRERLAARAEALPSTAELHQRVISRNLLLQAVLALEEPYRTSIALRFLDGLPPRTIAKRMGVPVETVRTRIKRGLEQLRATLDREHGGREAWLTAIAPLAPAGGQFAAAVATLTGVMLVTTKTKVFAAALVGVALALCFLRLAVPPDATAADQPGHAATAAPVVATPSATSQASRTRLTSESQRGPESAPTGSLLVHVRWSDGSKAADLGVRVLPTSAVGRMPQGHTLGDGELAEARSDAEGDVLFTGLPPQTVAITLDRGGFVPARIETGKQVEVTARCGYTPTVPPDAPSYRARQVEGIVVGPDGVPVAGAEILASDPTLRSRPFVVARSAVDGTFFLRDMQTYALIEARAPGFAPSARHCDIFHLHVRDDPSPKLRIKLVLPALGGSLSGMVRDPRGQLVPGALVQVGAHPGYPTAEVLRLEDGTTAALPNPHYARTDAHGRFLCEGIAVGRQDVIVHVGGLGMWTGQVEIVARRESMITIDLAPPVTARGHARDSTGAPQRDVAVQAILPGRVLRTTRTDADGSYELGMLPAGDLEIRATGELGEVATKLSARGGDVLDWDPVFAAGLELFGKVVDDQGAPVECWVRAQALVEPRIAKDVVTDAQGAFRIRGWRDVATRIDVTIRLGGFPNARLEDARPGREIVITVRAADQPSAFVTGSIVGPADQPLPGVQVRARSPGFARSSPATATADPQSGAFRLGPLPAGTWQLEVSAKDSASLYVTVEALAARETRELGALRLVTPGILAVTARRADGAPLTDATWLVTDERGGSAGWFSVKDGKGVLNTLAPGEYRIQARGAGVAHAQHRCTIVAGERTPLAVTLQPAGSLQVTLVPPPDDPSLELRLVVKDAKGNPEVEQVLQRGQRSLAFTQSLGLLPGVHRLEARTQSHAATREVTVESGRAEQTLRVDLR